MGREGAAHQGGAVSSLLASVLDAARGRGKKALTSEEAGGLGEGEAEAEEAQVSGPGWWLAWAQGSGPP